jgi:hypothetical protein
VDAAVEGDDLVGQVGIGQDRCGEIGNLGRLAEPADRDLPAQLCRVVGQYPGLVDQRRASALTVIPDAASREARKWVSPCSPGRRKVAEAGLDPAIVDEAVEAARRSA